MESGGDRLCQTSPIPRSPDGDKNKLKFGCVSLGCCRSSWSFCLVKVIGLDNHSPAEQIFHKTIFLSAGVPVWYLQGIDILLCLFYSVSPGLLLVFLLAMINAMIFRVMVLVMDLFSATRNVKNYIQCLNSNSTRYKEIPPPRPLARGDAAGT